MGNSNPKSSKNQQQSLKRFQRAPWISEDGKEKPLKPAEAALTTDDHDELDVLFSHRSNSCGSKSPSLKMAFKWTMKATRASVLKGKCIGRVQGVSLTSICHFMKEDTWLQQLCLGGNTSACLRYRRLFRWGICWRKMKEQKLTLTHTCLIDASIYVAICKVMHDKGKVMGQQQVGFQHSWETCTPKQPDLWWKTGRFNSQSWAGTSGWSDHSSTEMP